MGRPGRLDGSLDGIENGLSGLDLGPALAGRHPTDDVRAVRDHATGVKAAFASGDSLDDDPRVLIEPDRHQAAPFAAATALAAPSSIVSTEVIPALARISRPSFSLVPVNCTTSGTLRRPSPESASTIPAAT